MGMRGDYEPTSGGASLMRAGRRIAAATVLAVVAALASPFYAAAAASTLYVGGAGCSDSGPGTQAQPFCTISEAAAVATAGQTVLVSSGTYTENVTPAHSGTAGNPIIFQAAHGATATVTGAADGFTLSSRSWITISGFTITGTTSSGIYLSNSSNITVSGNTVTASGQRIQGANAQGIYVSGTTNSTISGNQSDNNSATGDLPDPGTPKGSRWRATRRRSTRTGGSATRKGIDVRSSGNTITRNVVHDNEDSGIQFYPGGNNNVAAGNISYHNNGITTVQLTNCTHPTTGNTSDCFTGDHGIDDLNVTGNQITGNTIFANSTAGINVEGLPAGTNSGITIKNNVSVDNAINCPDGAGGTTTCPGTKGNIRVDSTSGTGTVLDRDVLWIDGTGYLATWGNSLLRTLSALQSASGQEPNGKQGDPGFENPSAGNFQLTAGSPAIDMADSGAVGEQTTDIRRATRGWTTRPRRTPVSGRAAYDDAGAYRVPGAPGGADAPGDRERHQRDPELDRAPTRHAGDRHLHHLPGHQPRQRDAARDRQRAGHAIHRQRGDRGHHVLLPGHRDQLDRHVGPVRRRRARSPAARPPRPSPSGRRHRPRSPPARPRRRSAHRPGSSRATSWSPGWRWAAPSPASASAPAGRRSPGPR